MAWTRVIATMIEWISLVVQWLRLCASTADGPGSKIPHDTQQLKNNDREKEMDSWYILEVKLTELAGKLDTGWESEWKGKGGEDVS